MQPQPHPPPAPATGPASRRATRLLRRLVHALANHGVTGLIQHVAARLMARRAGAPDTVTAEQRHPFDVAYGTDTGGYIPGEQIAEQLGVHKPERSAAAFWNTAYYAISPSTLTEALTMLPEPAAGFTFVDLGCGKGRALLIAAQTGFGQVLGVEISPELVAVARHNASAAAAGVRVEQDDAATFTYPSGPLVIFLYHPFLRPLLRRVLWNLERQIRQTPPRPVYLLYANPGYQHTLRQMRWLTQVWDFSLRLSAEDAAADRHGITHERFTLYRITL